MPDVPTAPNNHAPITLGPWGSRHQIVKPSAASATAPSSTVFFYDQNLPNATLASAYSQSLTAGGGASPYTFAIAGGSLPTGLSLSSAGVISGTPSGSTGTSSFSVTATDANGSSATQSLTLIVASASVAGATNYGFFA